MKPTAARARAIKLAELAADPRTPANEARNAGVKLARLLVEHKLLSEKPTNGAADRVADAASKVREAATDVARNESVQATAKSVTDAAEATVGVIDAFAKFVSKVQRRRT